MNSHFWHDRGLAWRLASGILGLDWRRQERIEKQMADEAIERCGFKVEYRRTAPALDAQRVAEIVTATGEKLTKEQERQLADMFLVVKAEWKQREEEAKAAQERERQAKEARLKAEYDAAAAPFREARRLKYQKRFEAEQARKAKA